MEEACLFLTVGAGCAREDVVAALVLTTRTPVSAAAMARAPGARMMVTRTRHNTPHTEMECYGSSQHCAWHGVDEPDQGAYRVCLECRHVYATKADLERAWDEMWAGDGGYPFPEDTIPGCAYCGHDWLWMTTRMSMCGYSPRWSSLSQMPSGRFTLLPRRFTACGTSFRSARVARKEQCR